MEKQNSEDRIQNKKVYGIFIDGGEPSGMIHERLRWKWAMITVPAIRP